MTMTEKRYSDVRFETASRDDILAYQLHHVRSLMESTSRGNPFYREFWRERGSTPDRVDSLHQFSAEVPLIRKADLIKDQAEAPPYGKRLAAVAEGGRPFLVFNTSGTSGQGVELHAITTEERQKAFAISAYFYRWSGLSRGDRIFLCYPISMLGGGRIELYGLEDYGLTVFPVAPYEVKRKLDLITKFQPHAIMATTSYLGHLSAVGGKLVRIPTLKVLYGGGEGGSYSWFEAQQELWGAPLFNHYGSTQTRVDHMYPCERGIGTAQHPGLLHNIEPGFYIEVIDLKTGAHVRDGERGEIVVTSLIHTDFPLIRYATGDAAIYRDWRYCSCRRPFSGVEIGSIARIDDMKKIKGINVWPQAVDEAIFRHVGVDEYQVVLSRDATQADTATVRVMPKLDVSGADVSSLCEKIRGELRNRIGINFEVTVALPGQISHSEYKARRWIDQRLPGQGTQ